MEHFPYSRGVLNVVSKAFSLDVLRDKVDQRGRTVRIAGGEDLNVMNTHEVRMVQGCNPLDFVNIMGQRGGILWQVRTIKLEEYCTLYVGVRGFPDLTGEVPTYTLQQFVLSNTWQFCLHTLTSPPKTIVDIFARLLDG
jgi:hypothetical protein